MGGDAPGLYVHVPFCVSKCRYCAFASGTDMSGIPAWVAGVLHEARRRAGSFAPFDTLYLGGGTPGLLPIPALAMLLEGLRRALPFRDPVEATIEANPGDVTRERAAAWLDLGLNRVSLGVQSFDDAVLRFLGRRHDAGQAARALEAVLAAGFDNLSIDLIYGVPDPTDASWESTLDRSLAFDPGHLSCYSLTVEPRTPLARDVRRGTVALPGEDFLADRFLATSARLARAGYVHYEVSNFARGDSRRSRHNSRYWRHVPYLGLGPAAHSFDGSRRWWNVRSLAAYLRRDSASRLPTAVIERLSPADLRMESLALGFRTREGVELGLLGRDPGSLRRLQHLVSDGRLVVEAGRARPTHRGMLIADALARSFA